MRSKICLWAVLLLSLSPIISFAQNQNNSSVRELYVRSGLEKQMEQLPYLTRTFFNQAVLEDPQAAKLPKDVLAAIRSSIPEAFAPERLKETVLAELTGQLTPGDITEVLKWLDSPFGMKCTQLEEGAATGEAQAEIQRYAAHLQGTPPTAERLKALRELDSAVKISEFAAEAAVHTQIAVAMAINATLPKEQQRPLDDISHEVEKVRPSLEAKVRSQVLFTLLYTYRSLTDAEIKLYTNFARSPAGSKFASVTMAAFDKANLEGSVKWGKLIGDILKEGKSSSEA